MIGRLNRDSSKLCALLENGDYRRDLRPYFTACRKMPKIHGLIYVLLNFLVK